MKKSLFCAALIILTTNGAVARPHRSHTEPTQVGDHYVQGHFVEPHYTPSGVIKGYTRSDGRFVEPRIREGRFREGHFKEGHYVHPRRR